MFDRWYSDLLREKLVRPFVHLMFGARQTGKSTLLRSLLPDDATVFDLSDPEERSRLLARPGLFLEACRALPTDRQGHAVFVDEVQMVPALFDGNPWRSDRSFLCQHGRTETILIVDPHICVMQWQKKIYRHMSVRSMDVVGR